MKLILVTGNKDKFKEVREILGSEFELENTDLDLEEIQEIDPKKIITRKAEDAYKIIQRPLIVEDNSLNITALNGFPGPLIKWVLKTVGNSGLVKMLSSFPDKSAEAIVIFAYTDGVNTKLFKGTVPGRLIDHDRGQNGFGWDMIFIPDGSSKTFAEMSSNQKNKISPRGIALSHVKEYLKHLNGN